MIFLSYNTNHNMEETIGSERFSFGDVQDTEYVPFEIVDTQVKLPYNPFLFQFKLTIIKTKPNYEQVGLSYPLLRQKRTVFCRKKKVVKEWSDQDATPIYLNAEIISEKHFSINQNYEIKDENSRHGTYLWISKQNPHKIESGDTFLIAKQPLVITKVQGIPKPLVEISYQGKSIQITQQRKIFLIGSHKKCHLKVPTLYEFQVCLNLANLIIYTNLSEQETCADHGLWFKLRNDKTNLIKLEYGSIILVDPYILKVGS